MKKIGLLVIGLLIGIVSCVSEDEFQNILDSQRNSGQVDALDQKEDEVVEVDNTPVDSVDVSLLHGGDQLTWKTASFTIEGSSAYSACRLDDIMELKSDGTYAFDAGDTFCGLADNRQTTTGVWEVGSNGTTLVFDKTTANEFITTVVDQSESRIEMVGTYTALGVSLQLRGVFTK